MLTVLINDGLSPNYESNHDYFASIDQWAQQHCPTYVGYTVQDVSDVSLQWDEIASYEFRDEKSANWFKLRWLPAS